MKPNQQQQQKNTNKRQWKNNPHFFHFSEIFEEDKELSWKDRKPWKDSLGVLSIIIFFSLMISLMEELAVFEGMQHLFFFFPFFSRSVENGLPSSAASDKLIELGKRTFHQVLAK